MKAVFTLLCSLMITAPLYSENKAAEVYYEEMEKIEVLIEAIETKYRADFAPYLEEADKVEVFITKFDDLEDDDAFSDKENSILVAPYSKRAKIIQSTEVTGEQRTNLLNLLARQIAVTNHSGGAFCHYPIHGIRAYKDQKLIYEGTFCWMCHNFSFSYPQSSRWLDTSPELQKAFTSIIPIPQSEIDRFKKNNK